MWFFFLSIFFLGETESSMISLHEMASKRREKRSKTIEVIESSMQETWRLTILYLILPYGLHLACFYLQEPLMSGQKSIQDGKSSDESKRSCGHLSVISSCSVHRGVNVVPIPEISHNGSVNDLVTIEDLAEFLKQKTSFWE
jgi:hypothetical protein